MGKSGNVLLRKVVIICMMIVVQISLFSKSAFSTHAAGSDLTYHCLGGNLYEIEVSFYRDCAGIDAPAVITVYYRSVSCGYNLNVTVSQVPNSEVEISVPCSTSTTTCNNGITTGIKKFLYRATVNLPAACSDWVFSYSICCRNCSITTIDDPCGNSSNLYVEAKLNNLTAPSNSSPSFSNNPIAFVCVGQNFNFNQGVFDIDGDSLSYSLITPKTGPNSTVQFLPPATMAAPIASSTPFTINAVTGDINFTPSQIQIGVLAVLVQEYRNGQLIGSVIRDIQVYATACFNSLPVASGIDGSSNYAVTVCPGQQICFDIFTSDDDSSQAVSMTSNNGIQGGTFTVSGGNRPTGTFCWTPGFNDVDLLPKTFTVTVKDNNCPTNGQQTFSFSIFVPSPFFTVTTSDVSCYNGIDGSAIAAPVYGNLYNYSWNTTPVQNGPDATGLTAGTYTLTVSDTNSCSLSVPVTIGQPDSIQILANVTPSSCSGLCNGAIDLSVNGGHPGYTLLWNDGSTLQNRTSLCHGVYTVTITDINGCSSVKTIVVNDGLQLSAAIDAINVSCNGLNDGVADLQLNGAVQPIQYLWSTGETTEDISGLAPGNYNVTFVDGNFCSGTASVTINEPDVISINATIANVTCFDANDGLIDLTVTGGNGSFSYLWSVNSNFEDLSNLGAGIYSVSVADIYGCSATESFTVNEPSPISISALVNDVNCFGGMDGTIDITTSGGNGQYSYLWSNGSSSENIGSLSSGTYALHIVDAHQCTFDTSYTINQPDAFTHSFISSNASCLSGNGAAEINVTGGTPSYSFLWSNGATTSQIAGLLPGTYTITVTDFKGCYFIDSIVIGNTSAAISLAFTTVSTNCFNSTDGSIDLSVNGGVEPYSFLWSDGSIAEDLLLVAGGNYSVTVTDANGCSQTGTALIESPDPLIATVLVTQISCNVTKGVIDLEVTGGSAPYIYSWSSGETGQDLTNLDPGTYTVTYSDINGCSGSISTEIIAIPDLVLTAEAGNVTSQGGADGSIDLTVAGGLMPYTFVWSNGETTEDLNNLTGGVYTVTVTDASGCSATTSVEVFENITSSIAENENDLQIAVLNNGNGASTIVLTTIEAGNYTMQIYDQSARLISKLYEGRISAKQVIHVSTQNLNLAGGIYLLQVNSPISQKSLKLFVRN